MKTQRIWGTLDPFYETGPVLGRKVANIGFLNELLTEDPFDEYHFFLSSGNVRDSLIGFIKENFPKLIENNKVKILDRRDLPEYINKQEYFCFHQSDCIVYPPHLARVRNAFAKNIFPITGTTHSLSYSNYGSAFLNYIWKGTTARDCIVATSTPGMQVVEKYFLHLREGFELDEKKFPSPQIKKIPLGINPSTFTPPTPQQKLEALDALELNSGDNRVNILVFGRIAHYSKMDILPLLRAMQRIFKAGIDRKDVRVILAGWMDDEDDFPQTLKEISRNMGLELSIFARPTDLQKIDLYRAADIYVSISDNPQETFGLTILEAGAMGLPIIASDYDGYKDLVVHDETGFLIETIGAEATPAVDLMAPLCFDSHYHLLISQQTAIDTPKLAKGLEKLIKDSQLRSAMGTAGAVRVNKKFTWKEVIRQHIQLWEELNTAPVETKGISEILHPAQVRFGEIFSHYPTSTISKETMVVTGSTGLAIYQGKEFPLIYQGIERYLNQEVVRKMAFFARKPITTLELITKIKSMVPELDKREAEFHILWSLKHDILEKVC
ncbi:glycosyltransferase family 4 protein [Maridesulfovibrio ferrireducens]|uniref:glycosyltransferase family 4 protein n=1 Tax=Maridesulfovibrio ferrireducens TaxID=246191 RepID=UPI001A2512FE|nr:glycosyltransferase family 4 protein [Maridesulfovibrio ferrireducens]MBI9111088.1 glycosyltransferase family 4 protein [Maridesulfovibrio ferrireducens]